MTRASREYLTDSPEATEAVGEAVARELLAGDLVLLQGELASGKTTLVRGLLRGLGGAASEVTSPTFVLLQSYPCSHPSIRVLHHVDLYRVGGVPSALRELGLEELLSEPDAVVAVEWPAEVLVDWLPQSSRRIEVGLEVRADGRRRVEVLAVGEGPLSPRPSG
jgi:tRNA threonylcarbamoyladenosine biosynthesis protein TsaE